MEKGKLYLIPSYLSDNNNGDNTSTDAQDATAASDVIVNDSEVGMPGQDAGRILPLSAEGAGEETALVVD